MAAHPTIAFDLDGTLVDTAPDLLEALNVVLSDAGLKPVEAETARGLFGGGARVMIERGLALNGMRLEPHEIDRMQAQFLEYYGAHIADRSQAFPGAANALEALAARDACLVVVTNKLERYAVKLLTALGLARYFAVIAGPDTFGVRKPDPGHLVGAVMRAGGDPQRTVLIGDSEVDVATAHAADVPVIAVSYGYTTVHAAALGADRVVDRLADVPAVVESLVRMRPAAE